jgi:hypothetical protein
MYSGTTLTPLSGRILGAHQKVDRLARGSLASLLKKDSLFPAAKLIMHFEGNNGPDAIKRKSPAQDEPWHYYAPFDETDTQLLAILSAHYDHLVRALREHDDVRAGFEASWLAHGVVDGLTPAHHYPYEEKLAELRGGASLESRDTFKGKLLMPGQTRREQVKNNWNMWGAKGLISTHFLFEWGIAFLTVPFTQKQVALSEQDFTELHEHGAIELFKRRAKEISALDLYDSYQMHGWTHTLASRVRRKLMPAIVRTVTLIWYAAAVDAGIAHKDLR